MAVPIQFQTARLTGERLDICHYEDLCRMHQNPDVMANLGGVRDAEATRTYLERNLDHWNRFGYGIWVIREKCSDRFAGRAGLRHTQIGSKDEIELAYALLPEFWGCGLATELCTELVSRAFVELDLEEIVCFTLTKNLASERVMQKSGFGFEQELLHANLPHVLYRQRREQWTRASISREE